MEICLMSLCSIFNFPACLSWFLISSRQSERFRYFLQIFIKAVICMENEFSKYTKNRENCTKRMCVCFFPQELFGLKVCWTAISYLFSRKVGNLYKWGRNSKATGIWFYRRILRILWTEQRMVKRKWQLERHSYVKS